jgi:hypothetical protein
VILKWAQRAALGGSLVAAAIASGVAAPPATAPQQPARQLTVAQSGVRFRLGPFFLGPDWIDMTLIIENERSAAVRIAAVYRRDDSGAPRVALADGRGDTCEAAADPAGIATVSDPDLAATAPAAIGSMTKLGPRSGMNISLRFPECRLSKLSRLSLSGEFAVSLDGRATEIMKVPLWGIGQRTITR